MGRSIAQKIAFCLDIDGVLFRGEKVIPEAIRAMQILYQDRNIPLVPLCFLTNSGGQTEHQKAKQLSEKLLVNVTEDQVVLSHTPFKKIIQTTRYNGPSLIIGRGETEAVARKYGLEHVVKSKDLASRDPTCVPFLSLSDGILPSKLNEKRSYGTDYDPIGSIFVFTDPAGPEWYIDLQVSLDLLTSEGVFDGTCQGSHIPMVYASHSDLLWKNEFPLPRLGLGSFMLCLEQLYKQITGETLSYQTFGKPRSEVYAIAADKLRNQADTLWGTRDISNIYAVGDNPAVDVKGANSQGKPWTSVLVRTGVFQGINCHTNKADISVDNVLDAILTGLNIEKDSR